MGDTTYCMTDSSVYCVIPEGVCYNYIPTQGFAIASPWAIIFHPFGIQIVDKPVSTGAG
ncbi:MAG: hypothetical protein PHO32_03530 [Candidatus Cloacimonetes bacterium]|nr:hypothetical protein [Candidatus Cloacimonadota bacterium]